jgi:hypothetical protein
MKNGNSQASEIEASKQKLLLPLLLLSLFVANFAFCLCGFSFTPQPLNTVRAFLGYLIPLAFYLAIKNTATFRLKGLMLKISLVIAILSLFGLMIDLWGGELNFRKTATNEEPGASFWSDINTRHTIIQKEYVRQRGQTIVLDSITEEGIEDTRIIELRYVRSLGEFLKQTKSICKIDGYSDASFVVNESKKTLTVKAGSNSGEERRVEQTFSTDFDKVSPCTLKH